LIDIFFTFTFGWYLHFIQTKIHFKKIDLTFIALNNHDEKWGVFIYHTFCLIFLHLVSLSLSSSYVHYKIVSRNFDNANHVKNIFSWVYVCWSQMSYVLVTNDAHISRVTYFQPLQNISSYLYMLHMFFEHTTSMCKKHI